MELFFQASYKSEEEEISHGNKTLNIKQETQNKLIFHYGKYSMKKIIWVIGVLRRTVVSD